MPRVVEPEILDELPVEAKEAQRSRGDLVRVNTLMRHAHLIRRSLPDHVTDVVDLGAGDGTLLLKVLQHGPVKVKSVTLVDRQQIVNETTLAQFRRQGISVAVVVADVFEWLRRGNVPQAAIVANLFLHHFKTSELKELLSLAAQRCRVFIACEPRRGSWPGFAASLLGLIGCNHVTRHDARVSVRAGFRDSELTALWPDVAAWQIEERETGFFSHLFTARRL
jgi:Methyltransferase domain